MSCGRCLLSSPSSSCSSSFSFLSVSSFLFPLLRLLFHHHHLLLLLFLHLLFHLLLLFLLPHILLLLFSVFLLTRSFSLRPYPLPASSFRLSSLFSFFSLWGPLNAFFFFVFFIIFFVEFVHVNTVIPSTLMKDAVFFMSSFLVHIFPRKTR